eukprot:g6738.t1
MIVSHDSVLRHVDSVWDALKGEARDREENKGSMAYDQDQDPVLDQWLEEHFAQRPIHSGRCKRCGLMLDEAYGSEFCRLHVKYCSDTGV